jgi:hypothetical protein
MAYDHQDSESEVKPAGKRRKSNIQQTDTRTDGNRDSVAHRKHQEKGQKAHRQGQHKRSYEQQETSTVLQQDWGTHGKQDSDSDAPRGKRHKLNVQLQDSDGELNVQAQDSDGEQARVREESESDVKPAGRRRKSNNQQTATRKDGNGDSVAHLKHQQKEPKSRRQGQHKRSYERQETSSVLQQDRGTHGENDSGSDAPRGKRHKLNVQAQDSEGEPDPMRRKLPVTVLTEEQMENWKKQMPKVEWRNGVWVGEGPARKDPPRPFGMRRPVKRNAIQVKKEPFDTDDENAPVVSARSRSVRAASVASSRISVQKNLTDILKSAKGTARRF